MLHWNPEVTLGGLVEIVLLVLTIIGAAVKFGRLETKLNIMYGWFERVVLHTNSGSDETRRFFGEHKDRGPEDHG